MPRVLLVVLLLGISACSDDGGDNTSNNGAVNNGANNGPANNGADACGPDTPEACLYQPPSFEFEEPVEITVRDPDRVGAPDREVFIAIRAPVDAPGPWPIVITSHGGSSGKRNAVTALQRWAEFAARRGFLAVSIAHPLRSDEEGAALCEELDATDEQCGAFKYGNYDRPRDFARVVDTLEELADTEPWAGKYDLTKIVYLGHSAGAGAGQMVGGACRSYYSMFVGDESFCAPDPRPIAFVGLSPQGIGDDGFKEGSWVDLDRPFLIATGANDGGADTGPIRRDGYYGSDDENQFLFYLNHPGAVHGLFGENVGNEPCTREIRDEPLCEAFDRWLRSTVAAFLDATLRDDPDARAWLRSDRILTAGAPHVEWDYR